MEKAKKELITMAIKKLAKNSIRQCTKRKLGNSHEEEQCIEVTQQLYDAGLTDCVDKWMPADEDGYAKLTSLNVGDFLIVEDEGVYCIRREEFLQTYVLVK